MRKLCKSHRCKARTFRTHAIVDNNCALRPTSKRFTHVLNLVFIIQVPYCDVRNSCGCGYKCHCWDMRPCRLLQIYQRLGGNDCLSHTCLFPTYCSIALDVPTYFGCKPHSSSGSYKCWRSINVLHNLSNVNGNDISMLCKSVCLFIKYLPCNNTINNLQWS